MIRVEPLAARHDRQRFDCGEPALDDYLRRQAGQDLRRQLAAVYVACVAEDPAVVGFYTLSSAGIDTSSLPAEVRSRLPYERLPATLLGRLAVDRTWHGRGLGQQLLIHALARCLENAGVVGSAFVVVQAKHDRAQAFYLKYGFQPLVDEPLTLYLPMRAVAALRDRRG